MTTLFEELDKILKEKNLQITCNEIEIKSLRNEIEALKRECDSLVAENKSLRFDVRMYQENEVSKHE